MPASSLPIICGKLTLESVKPLRIEDSVRIYRRGAELQNNVLVRYNLAITGALVARLVDAVGVDLNSSQRNLDAAS